MFKGRITPSRGRPGLWGLLSLFQIWAAGSCGPPLGFTWGGNAPTPSTSPVGRGVLYAFTPTTGHLGSVGLFVATYAVIMSMYGGGFATIPAYLRRDIFGHRPGERHPWAPARGLVRGRGGGPRCW